MKPIIGINVDVTGERPKEARVQANYYEAVTRAGGIPILIPPVADHDLEEIIKRIDGVMFIGGLDYCPSIYGEDKHEKSEIAHDDRVEFDLRFLQKCLQRKELAVLGICAGAQILNIGLGGSLHQDIPSEFPDSPVQHSSHNGWSEGFSKHNVNIEKGTALGTIYSKHELAVPTSHHQAVRTLGKGLRATAFADDGIIEAVELESHPYVIGVQWHPERDFEGNKELFESFIKASLTVKA
ncbi:MAG: gamma-glutamyl-gamma-aminobutyrate hydrolase family protein [Candidatus Obscuribacterales bacterium]|jgi:gamma-glutamyl-gamma-aminobutyrate hydrolase PuuD|nr:gamma-glutamyl-gamma-aminobutyrate hydrolase family protein [Candidatus Obscuribacterales bacterium]